MSSGIPCCVLMGAVALAGCASPAVKGPVPEARPLVQLVVDPSSDPSLRARVGKLLSSSGIEADFVLDESPRRPVDYTVRLWFNFREVPLRDIETVWQMTDLLLLTLYPATCNRYHFSLGARVEDAAGRRLKTYSFKDQDTAWVWLLMGPKCSSPAGLGGDGVGDIAEQLLRRLYRHMAEDHVLDRAIPVSGEAAPVPLVFVTANRAEDVFREEFPPEESSLRFTFDASRSGEAEYTLRLVLSHTGATYSSGRAALALLTAGVVGFCPTQAETLDGSIADRTGQLLVHYQVERSWRPPASTSCLMESEARRPEAVRGLARDMHSKVSGSWQARMASSSLPGAPLVMITTNTSRHVVENLTDKHRLFKRASFEESPNASPDYTLELHFMESGGGGRTGPEDSMARQLAIGFLFGLSLGNEAFLCKPTRHVLEAKLSGADGKLLADYEVVKTTATKGAGCSISADPGDIVVSALVDSLFSRISADSRLPADLRSSIRIEHRSQDSRRATGAGAEAHE